MPAAVALRCSAVAVVAAVLAQFCPVCGTTPCLEVARERGLRITAPPSPLPPQQNAELGGVAAGLLRDARLGLERASSDLRARLARLKPTSLLDAVESISAAGEELRNPTTLENWGEAVRADALTGVIASAYLGTAGTVPNPAVSGAATAASAQDAARGGHLPPSRIQQYFNLLDERIQEIFRQPPPAPEEDEADAEEQDPPTEAVVRERLVYTMVANYVEAGLYDQALEFHRLARERWGEPRDRELAARLEAEVEKAAQVVREAPVVTRGGGIEFGLRAEPVGAAVGRGECLVVNFRLRSEQEAPPLVLEIELGEREWERSLWLRLTGSGTVFLGDFALPEAAPLETDGSWNALRIEYARSGEAPLYSEVAFFLNGERLVLAGAPREGAFGGAAERLPARLTWQSGREDEVQTRLSTRPLPPLQIRIGEAQ